MRPSPENSRNEEDTVDKRTTLFNQGEPANTLYILINGAVDLFYRSEEEYYPNISEEFSVVEINPGEFYTISGLAVFIC